MCCPFLATRTEKELPLLPPGPMEIYAMSAEPLLLPSTELKKARAMVEAEYIYIYIYFFFYIFRNILRMFPGFSPLKFCMCKPSKIVFFLYFQVSRW